MEKRKGGEIEKKIREDTAKKIKVENDRKIKQGKDLKIKDDVIKKLKFGTGDSAKDAIDKRLKNEDGKRSRLRDETARRYENVRKAALPNFNVTGNSDQTKVTDAPSLDSSGEYEAHKQQPVSLAKKDQRQRDNRRYVLS